MRVIRKRGKMYNVNNTEYQFFRVKEMCECNLCLPYSRSERGPEETTGQ